MTDYFISFYTVPNGEEHYITSKPLDKEVAEDAGLTDGEEFDYSVFDYLRDRNPELLDQLERFDDSLQQFTRFSTLLQVINL